MKSLKIKKGFTLKNEDGQYIIVSDKNINPSFTTVIALTDTSAHLWNLLKYENATKEEMLNSLLNKFDISTVLALNDIDVFIRTLKENEILE